MSEAAIKKVLKDLNITDTEAEIYLYLAKYPVSKGTEIARQTKKDKAQVYHILKNLQTKGLVETTLEAPVRFTPVPFEKVVDSLIQTKREDAQRIEKTKQELLTYWKNLDKKRTAKQAETFVVISGRRKINAKISQMITESKSQLSAMATMPSLIRAEQDGLLDVASKNLNNKHIQFRFLTEVPSEHVTTIKKLLKKMNRMGL